MVFPVSELTPSNDSIVFYESVFNGFSLHVLYLEIFIRIFVNYVTKNICDEILKNMLEEQSFMEISFKTEFIFITCCHFKSLVDYLNRQLLLEQLDYIYCTSKKTDHSIYLICCKKYESEKFVN